MIKLTENQIRFLKKELNITADEIEQMNVAGWKNVRKACYDIVLDEMLDENDEYNEVGDGSERCSLASSIMDMKFRQLKGNEYEH